MEISTKKPDEKYWNRVSIKNIKIVKKLLTFCVGKLGLKKFDEILNFFLFNIPKKYSLGASMAISILKVAGKSNYLEFFRVLRVDGEDPKELLRTLEQMKNMKKMMRRHGVTDCLNGKKLYLTEFAYYTFKNPRRTICDYVDLTQKLNKKNKKLNSYSKKGGKLTLEMAIKIKIIFERELNRIMEKT